MPQSLQRVNARPQEQDTRRLRTLTVIHGGAYANPAHSTAIAGTSVAHRSDQAGLLSQADLASRGQIVVQMQRTHGNAHAQRVIAASRRTAPASSTVRVQRCGGHTCNCSPEQRAAHAATEKIDEALVQLSSIDISAEIQRSSGGSSLDPEARARLEPAMGMDLAHVAVHHDANADALSRSLDAEAFTSGNHIFFREGRYDPHSMAGLRLLAHEITHTVQQSNGAVSGVQHSSGVQVNEPGDNFEQEAERVADETIRRLGAADSPIALSTGGGAAGSRPNLIANSVQRRTDRLIIQRAPTTDTGQGLSAVWTPFARIAAPPFDQTTNFDRDGFHEEFNVPPKSSGRLILLADVAWKKSGAAPGPTPPGPLPPGPTPPGPLPPLPIPPIPGQIELCDPCTKIPSIAPQADLDSCFRLPDLCSRRTVAQALLSKYTKDPCELISTTGNIFEVIAKNAAKLACKGGLLAFKATGVGALIFEGIDALRQGLQDLESAACRSLGCAPVKPTPGPGPNPGPQPQAQEGKGRATFETRFFVGVDGKIQVVGLPPRIQASGAAAELVNPVEFIRTEIPGGVNIAFQPMLKGTTAGETNVFQHQWDVDLKQPAPPAPLPFSFGIRLHPFRTAKEFFENEEEIQGKFFTWFRTMDRRVLSRIVTRQIPVGVIGFASRLGNPAFNLTLSEKRAKRVAQMVNDFGGSFAGVVTFAVGELQSGGGPSDNTGFFRRADVGVCGQLEGADAAGGPIVDPAGNDQTVCTTVAPKTPSISGGGAAILDAGAEPPGDLEFS